MKEIASFGMKLWSNMLLNVKKVLNLAVWDMSDPWSLMFIGLSFMEEFSFIQRTQSHQKENLELCMKYFLWVLSLNKRVVHLLMDIKDVWKFSQLNCMKGVLLCWEVVRWLLKYNNFMNSFSVDEGNYFQFTLFK